MGDTYTYISSIYFIGDDGKLYEAEASGRANNDDIYDHNITLTETTNEYSIEATLVCDSGFQLVEFDDATNIYASRQRMASNGAATQIGKTKTDLLTVGTAGVYKVIVQTASIRNGVDDDGYLYVNNTEVAVLDVYTTTATTTIDKITLAAGDVISAQGTSSYTGVDYIVIIPVDGEEFTFAEEVQFATNEEKTAGTLRFKAGVLSKGFETTSYGFRFVNIKDEGVEVKQREVEAGEGDIAVNSVFYHDIEDIPNTAVGVGFYVLPYVCGADGEFFYGTPFTFNGELDWAADIQTETK